MHPSPSSASTCRPRSAPTRRPCASATCSSSPARRGSTRRPEPFASGGFAGEARQAFANVAQVLEASGSSLSQVAKLTVFMASADDFAGAQRALRRALPDRAARTLVPGRLSLPRGLLISIEAIAAA